jgi:hypothetical protein
MSKDKQCMFIYKFVSYCIRDDDRVFSRVYYQPFMLWTEILLLSNYNFLRLNKASTA